MGSACGLRPGDLKARRLKQVVLPMQEGGHDFFVSFAMHDARRTVAQSAFLEALVKHDSAISRQQEAGMEFEAEHGLELVFVEIDKTHPFRVADSCGDAAPLEAGFNEFTWPRSFVWIPIIICVPSELPAVAIGHQLQKALHDVPVMAEAHVEISVHARSFGAMPKQELANSEAVGFICPPATGSKSSSSIGKKGP